MPTLAQRLVLLGGAQSYASKITGLFGASIVSYLPLWEPAGATVAVDSSPQGNNGTPTAVTFGAAGVGDGRTAASLDGSTSSILWYSAGLAADFNGAEGCLMLWAKMSGAGVWTDGVQREFARLNVNISNRVTIQKTITNNRVDFIYSAGGTTESVSVTGLSTLVWFHLALNWSAAGDAVSAYMNGAQTGTTQTGLGTWAGALGATTTVIGASSNVPGNVHSGSLAHAILLNRPATAAEILAAATVA